MLLSRDQMIQAIRAGNELLKRRAKSHFKPFVLYMKPNYSMQWFHGLLCEKLQAFSENKIKKLMIFLPPQHGKSELTTRLFPAYLVGQNPDLKIGLITYAAHIAANFNRAIQLNIDNEKYGDVFPDTRLNYSQIFKTNAVGYVRSTEKFDIINRSGSIKTVGRGGPLTSEPIDIGIIDDPLKDREEANSETVRAALYSWYTDVFLTRLHNDSQQLIIQTRWHEKDLAGRILDIEKDWDVISLPAIRTKDECPYDPRKEGEVLWESRHSKEKILSIKKANEGTFNSLYQQDPKPNSQILVYPDWIRIQSFPDLDPITWGLDFGKTTGTNALVKCATQGTNGYAQECLYAKGVPVSTIVDSLKANGYKEGQIVWCDHIPTKINDLRLAGIAAFPAVKGAGSVSAGIDKIKEYQMHYIGDNIHEELRKYQWVTYDDIITNEPVDDFNHALDGVRYGILSKYFRGR